MLHRLSEFQRAALMMTREQVITSWVREQEWKRDHGEPHYTVLRDPQTGTVIARIGE